MASKIRTASANEGLAKTIDKAAELDSELKAITAESKTAKAIINERILDGIIQDGETSVKVEGEISSVTMSLVKKYAFDESSYNADIVEQAIEEGFLDGVISKDTVISIPHDKAKEVMAVLQKAGLAKFVSVDTKYGVDAQGYRDFVETASSDVEQGLKEILSDTITVKQYPRLLFSKTV